MSQERAERLLVDLQSLPEAPIIRDASITVRDFLKDPLTTKGKEEIIATAVRDCLSSLGNGEGIYPVYARGDLIEGLSVIDHWATQLVIAESLKDPEELVAKKAERILRKPNTTIHLQTLRFLLVNDYQELTLYLVENNQTAGVAEGEVLPQLEQKLMTMSDGIRSALIASKLAQRANLSDDFRHQAITKLVLYLQDTADGLENNFAAFVQEVTSLNLLKARTAQSIQDIQLVLPQDRISTAIDALDKLEARNEAQEKIESYQVLMTLARLRVKEALAEAIKLERIEEERRESLRRQIEQEEVNRGTEAQRLQEQEVAERTQRERAKEAELIARARQLFPRL